MKFSIRATAILIMLTFLVTCISMIPISAADADSGNGVRYTQKIVSVLYDNSGSMVNDNKNQYALYALQMLMALLDDSDVLIITPMNRNSVTVTNTSAGIEIDLSASDRNGEIVNALTSQSSFLSQIPDGGTPGSSIGVAVDQLEERGLKNRDNLATASENQEYWLVILTDGAFNEQSSAIGADQVIESYISDFPSLKTIYLGFGSLSPDLSNSDLTRKVPFIPYRAASTDDIVSAMQSVANQLSGRYTLDPSYYTVNGSTVTVNLNKCDIVFKSISVIAQDCGVKLSSAKHDGNTMSISQPCVIEPKGLTDKIKNGYSGVIQGSPYLSRGTLTLEFSGPISADKLSILAEPALIIQSYLEYYNGSDWERTTMQYINANLSKGDKIKVGYEVYDQATNKLVDLKKLFGDCESSITYASKSYQVGQEIPLVVGNNEINVLVSVMDGAYTMYSSIKCIIEENPNYYRVESSGDGKFPSSLKAQAVFTVYVNNQPLTADQLSAYTWKVTAKKPDGSDADHKASLGADGKVTVDISGVKSVFGTYPIEFSVTSEYGISRSTVHDVNNYPSSVTLTALNTGGMSLSQHQMTENTSELLFELLAEGKPLAFGGSFMTYTVLVDGQDVTQYAVVDGNTLKYAPHADHLGGVASLGEKLVSVKVEFPGEPSLSAGASTKLTVVSDEYSIVPIDHAAKTVNRFDLRNMDAVLYFKVLRDGKSITAEELTAAFESDQIKVTDNTGVFTWQLWAPCGRSVSVETVDGEPVLAFRVTKDWIKPFDHFAAMLIFNGEKSVTVDYYGATATDSILFPKSNAWSYIWRILVILFVIHCILYIIGFFNGRCRSLPSGVFITCAIYDDGDECNYRIAKNVNLTFWEKYSWHLARFIPHKKTLWYHQDSIKLGKGVFGYHDGELGFKFGKSTKMYKVIFDNNGSEAAVQFNDFRKALSSYDGKKSKPRPKGEKPVGERVRSIFPVESMDGYIPATQITNYQYYGMIDDDGKLKYIMSFVYKS